MGEGLRLGQDVLNRTSKVRAEGREIAEVHEKRLANNPAWPNDVLMSSRIKPPPLTALARCKMSSTRCQIPARISDRNRRRSSAASTRSARRTAIADAILFLEAFAERLPENFGHRSTVLISLRDAVRHRLENAANMHTAADLHVRPWFSNRADLKAVGVASDLRNTRRPASRNGIDSAMAAQKTALPPRSQPGESRRCGQGFESTRGFDPWNGVRLSCNCTK
jgi:hypothetical protein